MFKCVLVFLVSIAISIHSAAQEGSTVEESKEPVALQKDWSIGDYEKAGFVLGSLISEAKCPNLIESAYNSGCGGNARTKVCQVGKSALCFDETYGAFTDFEFILPSACESPNAEGLLSPHKIFRKSEVLLLGNKAKFWSARLNCGSEEQAEPRVVVDIRLRDNLDDVISTLSFPPIAKLFEHGKTVWFAGAVAEKAETDAGENYCVKKYPESVARMIEKGTGLVGMAGFVPQVVRQSGSKITDTKFVCYQKIEASFEEDQFSSLLSEAQEKNNQLPPSRQKSSDYFEKQFTQKLITEGRQKTKCPEGFSKVSESHVLLNDYYGIECQTPPASMDLLCPKGSAPTGQHVGGNVEKAKSGGNVTTLIYETSSTCFKSECYPGTFQYKENYCGACPQGTTFDPFETERYYKKDSLRALQAPSVILCKGPASLKLKKIDSPQEIQEEN